MNRWKASALFCFALLCANCKVPPALVPVIDDIGKIACVLAMAETSATPEMITDVCNIPLSQVLTLLAAHKQAEEINKRTFGDAGPCNR